MLLPTAPPSALILNTKREEVQAVPDPSPLKKSWLKFGLGKVKEGQEKEKEVVGSAALTLPARPRWKSWFGKKPAAVATATAVTPRGG